MQANKNIKALINQINKKIGTNVVNLGVDIKDQLTTEFIQTPSLKVNKALSGGIALGRITEIFGPEGSGKTTMCYEIIGKDMKENPDSYWGWYETEGSFSNKAAEHYGIDLSRLIFWQMDDSGAEKGLDVLESIIRNSGGDVKGIVVNSVAGLTPTSELESLMDKQSMGVQAKMMSKLMRKITAIVRKNNLAVIFINQIRDKISLYGGSATTGGRALRFFSSQRFEMRKVKIESGDKVKDEEYLKMNIKVVKNRFALTNPYVQTSLFARYGVGIDASLEIIELATEEGVIEAKAGGNYRYVTDAGEEVKIRGGKNLLAYLDENPDIMKEITEKIKNVKVQNLDNDEIDKIREGDAELQKEITNTEDVENEEVE